MFQETQIDYLESCTGKAELGVFGDYTDNGLNNAKPTSWYGLPGTMDAQHAATFGYHKGPDNEGALAPPVYLKQLDLRMGEVDPEAKELLLGSQEAHGCLRQLDDVMGGSADSGFLADLERDVYLRSFEDDRVKAAQDAWVVCMKGEGLNYVSPQEAAADFQLRALTPAEVKVASADVECDDQSRWSDTLLTIVLGYQEQLVERNHEAFEAVLDESLAMLRELETAVR